MSSFTKRIRTYTVINEIHIPLAESPEVHSIHLKPDDVIVCIEKDVWIPDSENDEPDEMSLAVIKQNFIEINKKFFQPL